MNKAYRIIFHIDLNAFFASCEIALNPALATIPIGIGGASGKGVLTTANYEARKYGVSSAMSVGEARRLCPQLKLLPVNFPLYKDKSQQFFDYLATYTELIEPASIDEGYVDMTDYCEGKDVLAVAQKIQADLKSQFQLPCSIGIAPNRFLAKMASDYKKPEGITVFRKRTVQSLLWPMPIEAMHGIGKKTVPNLKLLGIQTIGDLAQYEDTQKLSKFLGNSTHSFVQKAWGHDETPVDVTRQGSHQSIGQSKTYDPPIPSYVDAIKALETLTFKVHERLIEADLRAKSIAVSWRDEAFKTTSKQFSFSFHTDGLDDLWFEAERLFDALYQERPIALLSVSVSNLEKADRLVTQIDIYDVSQFPTKHDALKDTLDKINAHYQKPLLKKGTDHDPS